MDGFAQRDPLAKHHLAPMAELVCLRLASIFRAMHPDGMFTVIRRDPNTLWYTDLPWDPDVTDWGQEAALEYLMQSVPLRMRRMYAYASTLYLLHEWTYREDLNSLCDVWGLDEPDDSSDEDADWE